MLCRAAARHRAPKCAARYRPRLRTACTAGPGVRANGAIRISMRLCLDTDRKRAVRRTLPRRVVSACARGRRDITPPRSVLLQLLELRSEVAAQMDKGNGLAVGDDFGLKIYSTPLRLRHALGFRVTSSRGGAAISCGVKRAGVGWRRSTPAGAHQRKINQPLLTC